MDASRNLAGGVHFFHGFVYCCSNQYTLQLLFERLQRKDNPSQSHRTFHLSRQLLFVKKLDSVEIIMYNHIVNKYNTSIHNGGARGAMNSFKGYYGSGTPYAAIRASTYLAMIADEGLAGLTATAHSTPLE